MRSVLLVVDVQRGLFEATPPPYDADAVLSRINSLAARARTAGVPVVFVQHERDGSPLQHGSEKWQLDLRLVVEPQDVVLRKTTPDCFLRTELSNLLERWCTEELFICGYASEFCIDTTTRRAAALGFPVVLVSDAHTTHNKEHASAEEIRAHHNATLPNLTSFGPVIRAQVAEAISFGA